MKEQKHKMHRTNVHERLSTGTLPATQMDTNRTSSRAYEYLCHLEEAKQWLHTLTPLSLTLQQFEEEMRKGIILANIAQCLSPECVKKVFVEQQLQYRHTDNINFFLDALRSIGLPRVYYFEVFDLYGKKDMPRVVFCIHALAHFLFKTGRAAGIQDLLGRLSFSEELLAEKGREIGDARLPEFRAVGREVGEGLEGIRMLQCIAKQHLQRAAHRRKDIFLKALEEQEALLHTQQHTAQALAEQAKKALAAQRTRTIQSSLKTLLHKKAFEEVFFRRSTALFSIKQFLFLFFDIKDELEKEEAISRHHSLIINKIKENYYAEAYVEEVEVRIGLLMNNKIHAACVSMNRPTLEEALGEYPPETAEYKGFQRLLWVLQYEPWVLSVLLVGMEGAEEVISRYVVPLFSYGCSKREEFLFLKFVEYLYNYEHKGGVICKEGCRAQSASTAQSTSSTGSAAQQGLSLHSLVSGKVMVAYFRAMASIDFSKVLKALRTMEIDCDPSAIHFLLYNKEVHRDTALQDERTREEYLARLKNLKSVVHLTLSVLSNTLFPYSLRFFAKLVSSYPAEEVRSYLFTEFLLPYILAPDAYNNESISKELRKKAYLLCNTLTLLSANGFNSLSECNDYLVPLSRSMCEAYRVYCSVLDSMMNVEGVSEYFVSYDGAIRINRPVVYFRGSEVNGLLGVMQKHSHVYSNVCVCMVMGSVCGPVCGVTAKDGSVCGSVGGLVSGSYVRDGSVHGSVGCMSHSAGISQGHVGHVCAASGMVPTGTVSACGSTTPAPTHNTHNTHTIHSLHTQYTGSVQSSVASTPSKASTKRSKAKDSEDAHPIAILHSMKNLSTKNPNPIPFFLNDPALLSPAYKDVPPFLRSVKQRAVLLLQCASGRDLLDMLLRTPSKEENVQFQAYCSTATLQEFKDALYEDMLVLEAQGVVSRAAGYAELVGLLAEDIVTFKLMSAQRSRELEINKKTLESLNIKGSYLEEKIKAHEECMASYSEKIIVNKHKTYSFKASDLKSRGVISGASAFNELNGVCLLMSYRDCNRVFRLEVSVLDVRVVDALEVRLDELLHMRYLNQETVDIGGVLNLNLVELLKIINDRYVLE